MTGLASFWTWHGWEALVAIGTIALALATAILAFSTRATAARTQELAEETRSLGEKTGREVAAVEAQAAEAQRQVEISRSSLEVGLRPVLVDVPLGVIPEVRVAYVNGQVAVISDGGAVHVTGGPKHWHTSVPLRNQGNGIAFVRDVRLGFDGGDYRYVGTSDALTLPAGEAMRFKFTMPLLELQGDDGFPWNPPIDVASIMRLGVFTVAVTYSDIPGNVWATRLQVKRDLLSQGWLVASVELESLGRTAAVLAQG